MTAEAVRVTAGWARAPDITSGGATGANTSCKIYFQKCRKARDVIGFLDKISFKKRLEQATRGRHWRPGRGRGMRQGEMLGLSGVNHLPTDSCEGRRTVAG